MHSISMLGRYTLIIFTCISIRSQTALSAGNEGVTGLPIGHQEPEQSLYIRQATTTSAAPMTSSASVCAALPTVFWVPTGSNDFTNQVLFSANLGQHTEVYTIHS